MDPLAIAAGATALVSTILSIFANDARHVDLNVKGLHDEVTSLSRVANAISKSWKENRLVGVAELGPNQELWVTVKASLQDCHRTMEQLLQKLNETEKPGLMGRGIFKNPVKTIKLNLRSKDIATFQHRIHSHFIAMQGGLQVIQICLALQSNHDVTQGLTGLQTQIGRIESSMRSRTDLHALPARDWVEEDRIAHNLKQLLRATKTFSSSVSTVVSSGGLSSIGSGSEIGEPLSEEGFRKIESWIPPPAESDVESWKESSQRPTTPSTETLAPEVQNSDSDSDIDGDLMKKLQELAVEKWANKDYERAAIILEKVVDYRAKRGGQQPEMKKLEIQLACLWCLQSQWQRAETIALRHLGFTQKSEEDITVSHILHVLSLASFQEKDLEMASKHCKRAIKGKRKLLGKLHASAQESLALLAHIFEAGGDLPEAEGCRSLLPEEYSTEMQLEPLHYLSSNLPGIDISSITGAMIYGSKRPSSALSLSSLKNDRLDEQLEGPSGSKSAQKQDVNTTVQVLDNPEMPTHGLEAEGNTVFAGIDCTIVKDGLLEDAEGNVAGRTVSGDPVKLLGRQVNDNGDVIDKYDKGKGRVEPHKTSEEAEEENLAGPARDPEPTETGLPTALVPPSPDLPTNTLSASLAAKPTEGSSTEYGPPGNYVPVLETKLTPSKIGEAKPLFVGIDVGMTDTAVCFLTASPAIEMIEPVLIQKWPGYSLGGADTVPTAVTYRRDGTILWGFLATEDHDENLEIHDWFTRFLDEQEYDRAVRAGEGDLPPSHKHVQKWYRDFLHELYLHIRVFLKEMLPFFCWELGEIRFLFSAQTTWSPAVTEDLRLLAREAGFGCDGPKHSVEFSLTVAEAIAVATFSTQDPGYKDGDIVLVVNIRTATTDIALLKVDASDSRGAVLKELDNICGNEIGSLEIDLAFAALAHTRLRQAATSLCLDVRSMRMMVRQMIEKEFRQIRDDFGSEDYEQRGIQVPGLGVKDSSEAGNVIRGKMILRRVEVQTMFNQQLEKIFKLIDYQLDRINTVAPGSLVEYMVLWGSLGQSKYVLNQMQMRYAGPNPHICAPSVNITPSPALRQAAIGLVIDRQRKLNLERPRPRRCRHSLGVVCDQIYDPARHQGATLRVNPIDGLTYALDQISWVVKQGDVVETNCVEQEFYRYVDNNTMRRPWRSQLVISHSRLGTLPMCRGDDGAEILCVMTWGPITMDDLKMSDLKKFQRRSYRPMRQSTYYKAFYQIKILIDHINIEAEIWFNGAKWRQPPNVRPREDREMPEHKESVGDRDIELRN